MIHNVRRNLAFWLKCHRFYPAGFAAFYVGLSFMLVLLISATR